MTNKVILILCICYSWNFNVFALVPKISTTFMYTATSDLERLIHTETKLINLFHSYIEQEEANLERLKKYSAQAKANQQLILDQGIGKFVNPLNLFLTVKGLNAWGEQEEYVKNGSAKELLEQLHSNPIEWVGSLLPTEEDLHGAANALFRLQDTYNLKTRDLAKGRLADGLHTEALSAGECFELGRISMVALKDHYHALLWFKEAWRKLKTENPPTADIRLTLDFLATSLFAQGNLEHALFITRQLVQKFPDYRVAKDALEFIRGELKNRGKDPEKVALSATALPPLVNVRLDDGHLDNRDIYEALCRGENQDESEWSKLYCFYKRDTPFSKLAPFKVEILRLAEPRIVIFRNIVTNQEVQMMKSIAEPKFHTTENFLQYRVSKSAWVSDRDDKLVKSLSNRLQQATGLSMKTAEQLHLSCYGIGGHYEPHYDYYRMDKEDNDTFGYVQRFGGNRIATVLLYLSQPYLGGATVFTNLRLTLYPTKNDAAFWYNLRPNGTGDPRTRHAACPVLAGTKWIGNKWIHEYGQEFRRLCSKENV